jgi:hypothetical protein
MMRFLFLLSLLMCSHAIFAFDTLFVAPNAPKDIQLKSPPPDAPLSVFIVDAVWKVDGAAVPVSITEAGAVYHLNAASSLQNGFLYDSISYEVNGAVFHALDTLCLIHVYGAPTITSFKIDGHTSATKHQIGSLAVDVGVADTLDVTNVEVWIIDNCSLDTVKSTSNYLSYNLSYRLPASYYDVWAVASNGYFRDTTNVARVLTVRSVTSNKDVSEQPLPFRIVGSNLVFTRGELALNETISVYDAVGRIVYSGGSGRLADIHVPLGQGLYFVRFGSKTYKVAN